MCEDYGDDEKEGELGGNLNNQCLNVHDGNFTNGFWDSKFLEFSYWYGILRILLIKFDFNSPPNPPPQTLKSS